MGWGDLEVLILLRVLGVGDDAGGGDGGVNDRDNDVGVAGYDIRVLVVVVGWLARAGAGGGRWVAGYEEVVEALRCHVHVRKVASLQHLEVEVTMKEEGRHL